MIVPDGNGGFLADARADLDELAAAIGEDLAAGESGEDVDTVGGLVFGLIGRIPVRGELISTPGRLRVRDSRRRSAPHQAAAHLQASAARASAAAAPPPEAGAAPPPPDRLTRIA